MLNGFAKSPSAVFPFVFRHCSVRAWRRAQGARLREIGDRLLRLIPSALCLKPFCLRLIPQDSGALHLEFFGLPSVLGFSRGNDAQG
jgi:hypothetical protein